MDREAQQDWRDAQVPQKPYVYGTEPTKLIKDLVASGKLGMRTGEGFRKWTPQSADAVRERLQNFLAAQAKAKT